MPAAPEFRIGGLARYKGTFPKQIVIKGSLKVGTVARVQALGEIVAGKRVIVTEAHPIEVQIRTPEGDQTLNMPFSPLGAWEPVEEDGPGKKDTKLPVQITFEEPVKPVLLTEES